MLTASYSGGRNKKYGYYHCHYCKARHPARDLENRFREHVALIAAANFRVAADIKKASIVEIQEMILEADKEKQRAVAEDNRISRRLLSLVDLQLDGGITKDEYDEKRRELLAQRAVIQRNLALGCMTKDKFVDLLDDSEYILTRFTDFLGAAGCDELMVIVRALVGSTTTVSGSGNLSNHEKDGLYLLKTLLDPPEKGMASPAVGLSNFARIIAAKLKIARTILEEFFGDAPKHKEDQP